MKQVILALIVMVIGYVSIADAAVAGGKEWKVVTIELSAGTVDSRHFHPGAELVYVLEGAGLLEMDGKPPVALNPGVLTTLRSNRDHVLKNASQTRPLKVLVVLRLPHGDVRQRRGEQSNPVSLGLGF